MYSFDNIVRNIHWRSRQNRKQGRSTYMIISIWAAESIFSSVLLDSVRLFLVHLFCPLLDIIHAYWRKIIQFR